MVSVKMHWRMQLGPDAAMGSRERAEAHGTERDSSRRFARSHRGCFVKCDDADKGGGDKSRFSSGFQLRSVSSTLEQRGLTD